MSALVTRDDRDGLALLTLNRPDKLNSLTVGMFRELRAHVIDLKKDAAIGCVVLRGAGRCFSAGHDLGDIAEGEKVPSPGWHSETLRMLETLPQPVIAAVHGHCYTGALEVALAADFIIAADNAKFGDTHAKWALTPIWGMSQRLPRRVGYLKAKEMSYTARVYSGAEAAAFGLANQCVADDQLEGVVTAMAADIVATSWHSLRGNKMLYNKGQDYTFRDGVAFEMAESPGRGPDIEERLKAFQKG